MALITTDETSRTSSPLTPLASAILVLADEIISETWLTECLHRAGLASPDDTRNALSELDDRALIARADGEVLSLLPFSKPQTDERLRQWLRTWFGLEKALQKDETQLVTLTTNGGSKRA